MDTSHLYAACRLLDINCEYYAIVSDLMIDDDDETKWRNDLISAVNGDNHNVITSQTKLIENILDALQDINKF